LRDGHTYEDAIVDERGGVSIVDGRLQGCARRLLKPCPEIRKSGDEGDGARPVRRLEIVDQPDYCQRDVWPGVSGAFAHCDQGGDDLAMERFPLRRHSLEKGFCEHRAEVPDVLSADAREVALLDIVEDACVGCGKARRLMLTGVFLLATF
jgi:hypothetical protein